MNLLKCLWRDELGVLLSTEAVVVGTVGVVGLTVGMSAVSTAVNEELKEVAFAIRSLDQSYSIPEQNACGAWTAGSSYQQQPVEESLTELVCMIEEAEKEHRDQAKRLEDQLKREHDDKDRDREKSKRRKKDRDDDPA